MPDEGAAIDVTELGAEHDEIGLLPQYVVDPTELDFAKGKPLGQGAFGGAFEYDGGSSDPSDLAKIVFEDLVFDHNAATCVPAPVPTSSTLTFVFIFFSVAEPVAPSSSMLQVEYETLRSCACPVAVIARVVTIAMARWMYVTAWTRR